MARIPIEDHRTDCINGLFISEERGEEDAARVSLCYSIMKLGVPVFVEGNVDEKNYQFLKETFQELKKPFDTNLYKPFRYVTPCYEVANGVRLASFGSGERYTGFLGLWRESEWAVQLSLFRDVPYADGESVVRLWCEKESDEKYRRVLSGKVINRDVPFLNKYTKIVNHGLSLEEIAGFFRENSSSTAVVNELVELVGRERRYLPEGVMVDSYVGS